ncbi:MAG TPA: hypothetical protein VNU46_05550, partial [Gemmatimonadaceae bacterium]|nr:hypothetical protein [Gemmatimonadaceae bacterium]
MVRYLRPATIATACLLSGVISGSAQGQGDELTDSAKARRWAIEKQLEPLAVVDRKVMLTMRDGIRRKCGLADIISEGAGSPAPVRWKVRPRSRLRM